MTRLDRDVGRPTFAINLIARPPASVRNQLSAIQDAISVAVSDGVLYRCPPASLHLSVFQFVWSRSNGGLAQEPIWNGCKDRIIEGLETVISSTDALILGRPSIEAGESAVILKFDPSPALEALRDGISSRAGLHHLSTNRPAIQHVSIFRYNQEVPLEAVRGLCGNVAIALTPWAIEELALVRENVYPSLDLELIHSFRLRQRTSR